MAETAKTTDEKQLLHIVIGGELVDPQGITFRDPSKIDFVGAYPSYKKAHEAWQGAAHRSVDNALMRYFIIHAHRLLDPASGKELNQKAE